MSFINNSPINSPIFLIGFMGSGKTTMGKKISKSNDIPFIDLDRQFVEHSQMSIADFFDRHGEVKFRELESSLLKTIVLDKGLIVSTGGGTPCFHDNMEWMNRAGITVYLKLPPKALLKRLSGKEGVQRPLLKGKSDEELLEFISETLARREEYYDKAKLIIDAHKLNANEVMELISQHNN